MPEVETRTQTGTSERGWRVATSRPHDAGVWMVRPPIFASQEEAERVALALMRRGPEAPVTNAIILEQQGGQVRAPRWLHYRDLGRGKRETCG